MPGTIHASLNAMDGTAEHLATGFGRGVLHFLMPPLCIGCHAPVADVPALCPACWTKLAFIEAPLCDRLGTPFPYDQGEGTVSAAAIADPPLWDRARAAVAFDEVSRQLIHALKYHDRHEAGLLMARLMARAGQDLIAEADAIVPVPLYRWRLWQRRYNQSVLLARKIGEISGRPVKPDLLLRIRPTRRQAGLDAETRARNVRNAFKVPDEAETPVEGRSIVIVDDVLTTGATAAAATRALKEAGAVRVDILSFALVLQPKRIHI
jgi:ComF family protein